MRKISLSTRPCFSNTVAILAFFSCVLCSSIGWAQSGSPIVYVSGTGGLIFAVNTTSAASSVLISNSSAAYEGLIVGPDNTSIDNSTNNHPFLLYACDPAHNTIIRFDPNNVSAGVETVYAGTGGLQQPQCGRFTNSGDLIVASKVPGSGVWNIAGVANIALGAGGFPAPTQNPPNGSASATQVSQGIAQKNIGDLLIVDAANRQVIRSQYATIPAFAGIPTVFISASNLLPGPIGIARKSTGDIFISNQSKKGNNIVHYGAQGTNGSACVSFNNKISPSFMQMSADDTLYVAAGSSSSGAVYSVNTSTCAAVQIPTGNSLPPLNGIALPPTQVTQTQTFSGTQLFNFGFTAYQFSSPSCTLSVTATPTNLAVINLNIANATVNDPLDLPFGGAPGVNLGSDGFEFLFNVSIPAGATCTPEYSDGTSSQLFATEVDNLLVANPRIIRCGNANDPPTGCSVMESLGNYPLGGLLPSDSTYGGKGTQCQLFVINGNLSNSEPGMFCGFQSPLSNVPPPGIAGVFSSGQNVSVKFKLASTSGNCQNGPFITDAVALLSIAQIFDANGNAVFNPIAIGASGNSSPVQPIFKNDPNNKQYQFSLSLQGYAPGIYSLTVTFLSSNTVQQTIEIQVQ